MAEQAVEPNQEPISKYLGLGKISIKLFIRYLYFFPDNPSKFLIQDGIFESNARALSSDFLIIKKYLSLVFPKHLIEVSSKLISSLTICNNFFFFLQFFFCLDYS